MATKTSATVEDLHRVPEHGKVELVNGGLVLMSPIGGMPRYPAVEISVSLHNYTRRTRTGHAIADNVGFIVDLPIASLSSQTPPFTRVNSP